MFYTYEECNFFLDNINSKLIKEVTPIGFTKLEKLPIRHFILGTGGKHIVVTASQHSNEIIGTTFVIKLMSYLIKNNICFENLSIHFLPILNPEGYIVSTSAIRDILPAKIELDKQISFCYEFYRRYKIDSLSNENKFKLHQILFENTNHLCINSKYSILRDNVSKILSFHPKGSIIDWASNGSGIDLNSNSINKKVSAFEYNKPNQYNNIRMDIPSPIGYPGDNQSSSFKEEIEITSLINLLNHLKKDLLGFFNYHSTGGVIFQRPEDNNPFILCYNYLLSKFYQQYTVHDDKNYSIITERSNKITSVNDNLRITYPGNILIELSPMRGNPIGVFGDIKNYNNTIDSNIESFIYTMNNIESIYNISKEITKSITLDNVYIEIDNIYGNMNKKILKKN